MSTSKLQIYTGAQLRQRFAKYGIVENTRPSWLISTKGERLELDFYLERLGIAVEVQGGQHFKFTPVFHAREYDFKEQLRRDKDKLDVCQRAGIDLLYVCKRSDVEIVLTACYDTLAPSKNGSFVNSQLRTSWRGRMIKKRQVRTSTSAQSAMIVYGLLAEKGKLLKKKQVEKGLAFYLDMKKQLDSGHCFKRGKQARGFHYLECFLRKEKLIR